MIQKQTNIIELANNFFADLAKKGIQSAQESFAATAEETQYTWVSLSRRKIISLSEDQ